jgi:hypothetical protein
MICKLINNLETFYCAILGINFVKNKINWPCVGILNKVCKNCKEKKMMIYSLIIEKHTYYCKLDRKKRVSHPNGDKGVNPWPCPGFPTKTCNTCKERK